MSLFTMRVAACIQTCNLDIIQHIILHTTHQYMPQGLDPLGLKTLRLDYIYIYVATCIVSKDVLNFSQECVTIVIALVFTLYLQLLFYIFYTLTHCRWNGPLIKYPRFMDILYTSNVQPLILFLVNSSTLQMILLNPVPKKLHAGSPAVPN